MNTVKRDSDSSISLSASDSFTSTTSTDNVCLVERNYAPGGIKLVNPKQSGRIRPDDLVALAQDIQKSDSLIASVTCGKLKLIADQIEQLRKKAFEIMHESTKSLDLHRVACNFTKVPGTAYNLYERENGEKYFSMLSIEDWNHSPPHTYIGRYLLNADRSWTDLTNNPNESYQAQLMYQPPVKNHEVAKAIKYSHNPSESTPFMNPNNNRLQFSYQPNSEWGNLSMGSLGDGHSLTGVVESTFMDFDDQNITHSGH